MDENKIKILEEYFSYRRENDVKDDIIDNIFLKEMYWDKGNGEKSYLFPDLISIKKFFDITKDIEKKSVDDSPLQWGGPSVCGTMLRNSSICDSINEVIYS